MIGKLTHWAREYTKPAPNGEIGLSTVAVCLAGMAYGSLVFGEGLVNPLALCGSSIVLAGIGKWIGRSERRRREASEIVRYSLEDEQR